MSISKRNLADLEEYAALETDAVGSFTLETAIDAWQDYLTPEQVEEGLAQLEREGIIKSNRWGSYVYAYEMTNENKSEMKMKLTKRNIDKIVENVLLLETMSDEEAIEVLEDELEVSDGVVETVEFLNSPEGMDPKVRDFLDEAPTPDVVTVTETSKNCGLFIPTQKEISLKKSVGWPLSKWSSCEAIPSGDPTGGFGNEINPDTGKPFPSRVTVSGNLVIDGHHRWSQVWAIGGKKNPLLITDLALPGKDAAEKLAVAQVGIVATMDKPGPVPSEDKPVDDNVLGDEFTGDIIKKMILDRVGNAMDSGDPLMGDDWCDSAKNSELGQKFFNLDASMDTDTVRENVATIVGKNLAALPNFDKKAPARDKMPQFSLKTDPKDVFSNFEQGNVNFRDPFGGTVEESVDLKRWHKLAGIIKG